MQIDTDNSCIERTFDYQDLEDSAARAYYEVPLVGYRWANFVRLIVRGVNPHG